MPVKSATYATTHMGHLGVSSRSVVGSIHWTPRQARRRKRMDRLPTLTLGAEIFGCTDEADAEVSLPNAIDEDARGGRRATIGQPPGKGEAGGRSIGGQRMEHSGNAGSNSIGGLKPISALEQAGFARFFAGHER